MYFHLNESASRHPNDQIEFPIPCLLRCWNAVLIFNLRTNLSNGVYQFTLKNVFAWNTQNQTRFSSGSTREVQMTLMKWLV